jgi:hypothetical protein
VLRKRLVCSFGEKNFESNKVAVKQGFDSVDAIIFGAALVLNAMETQSKQKAYVA